MSVVAKTLSLLRPQSARQTIGPIGIDFALDSVHLVQLEKSTGGLPNVRARMSLPYGCPRREILQSPHQFRTLIRRALDADRFSGRSAIIAIPSGMFRTISVNFKSAPGRENESAAVLNVMKDRLDGELSDFVIDYLPVNSRSQSDERLALVAVSERKPIVEFLNLARKARLDVLSLEIGPVAISRLIGALSKEGGSQNVLVINSGRRASYLTLISGSDLLFDQEVAFGENGLIQQAAETLEMPEDMVRDLLTQTGVQDGGGESFADDADFSRTLTEILKPRFLKIVDEIKRVCMYAAAETRGGSVAEVFLLGSIARWPGSDLLLSKLIGINVSKVPNPLALFPQNGSSRSVSESSAPEIAVATGAALRGMSFDV